MRDEYPFLHHLTSQKPHALFPNQTNNNRISFYEYVHDNCDYYDAEGNLLGNWATEWQDAHIEDTDWYDCTSQHSQPLNANRKAYAAWWLWAKLAGWESATDDDTDEGGNGDNSSSGCLSPPFCSIDSVDKKRR